MPVTSKEKTHVSRGVYLNITLLRDLKKIKDSQNKLYGLKPELSISFYINKAIEYWLITINDLDDQN